MSGSPFFWRLYGAFVLLVLATAAVVGLLVHEPMRRAYLRETEKALVARAVLLRSLAEPALLGGAPEGFQDRIRRLGDEVATRFTVIGAGGAVIADSREDPGSMADHLQRPEIAEARREGIGASSRFSTTLGVEMMYVALPVERDGAILGYVRAALPTGAIARQLTTVRLIVLAGAGAAVAVGLLVALYIARRVSRRLSSLTSVVESIAAGRLEQRVVEDEEDEFGKLARAVNRMALALRERIDTFTRNRNQLLAVLEGMIEGVIAVDQDERVLHINEAAGRILRTSARGSARKWVWEITSIRPLIEAVSRAVREGEKTRSEVEIPGRAGDQVIELSTSPLRDAAGRIAGAVMVLHDITQLRRLESMRRDFVANVSHELKTPVAAVRALVETIHDDLEMDPATRGRFLGRVLDQCNRLSALVTDLLALSRLESTPQEVERYPVDVGGVVNEAVHSLLSVAEDKGLTVETQVPDEAVEVLGDVEMLHQLVSNLLDNAIKYTPAGGRIDLRLKASDGRAVLEVQDTGVGIGPRDQERVFERFYRVDRARSRELGGTGLGLSIVKHIVLALEGRVAVTSVLGEGSTFRVDLPLAPRPAAGKGA